MPIVGFVHLTLTLRWFRGNLSPENVASLQVERPEVKFASLNSYIIMQYIVCLSQNSCHRVQQHRGHNPAVDIQLPGFRWLQGINRSGNGTSRKPFFSTTRITTRSYIYLHSTELNRGSLRSTYPHLGV
jgi:hypothetical protein